MKIAVSAKLEQKTCLIREYAINLTNESVGVDGFAVTLMQIYYKIGLVGLKLRTHESASWVDELGRGIAPADVSSETSVIVHPAFHRALGIRPS